MAHVGKDNQLCSRNDGRKIVRVSTSNEFFMVAIGDGNPRHFDSSGLLRHIEKTLRDKEVFPKASTKYFYFRP